MQCQSLEENKRGVTQCHGHPSGEKVLACKHDNATLWWPVSLTAVLTPLHKAPSIATKIHNLILVHICLQHCLVRASVPLKGRQMPALCIPALQRSQLGSLQSTGRDGFSSRHTHPADINCS